MANSNFNYSPRSLGSPTGGMNQAPVSSEVKYIAMGQFYASKQPKEIRTVLGSCIAVCAYDPVLKIGGMNHFLTPGDMMLHDATAQYGVFAMEFLINELIIMGSLKTNLELKIFGGATMMRCNINIGELNIDFVKQYCVDEKLRIVGESMGGTHARKICFLTHTGEVRQMKVLRQEDSIKKDEKQYVASHTKQPVKPRGRGNMEMF